MTQEPAAPQPIPAERREITVRRAPKLVPFLVLGGILGIIAAAIVAVVGPGSDEFDRSTVFGFFAVLLAIPGVGLGAVAALAFDLAGRRHSTTAVVEAVPDSEEP
ncbi:hypothetical protein ACQCSX_12230 [Pseudarthrobacter sp. P1]|uniref:hypothetical protein n=1 Tax=Pseudarthrobacter sp. P1 TaxID=3418418 RepID=UPI003CFB2EE3